MRKDLLRILVIGDTHFKQSRIREGEAFVDACIVKVRMYNPEVIICLGDTLDTHHIVRVQPHRLAHRFLLSLTEVAPTYLLIGNHDLINHKQFLSDQHIFNPYKKWPRLTVVDAPLKVNIKNYKFIMCPYVPPGRFSEALDTLLETNSPFHWSVDVDCIFAHQEFHGSCMGAVVSTNGDEWSLAYPPVISGHIHEAQDLVEDNVFYPGSVLQHTFGEKTPKRIWLVTFGKSLDLPFDREFINLGLKPRRVIKMNVEDVVAKFDFRCLHQAYIKLEISGTPEHLRMFRQAPIYSKLVLAGVKISFLNLDVQASDSLPERSFRKEMNSVERATQYRTLLNHLVTQDNNVDLAEAYKELLDS